MRERGTGRIYLRKTYWWMQYYDHDGTLVRESTGETDEAEAERVLNKRIGHVEAGLKVGGAFDKTTLAELLDDVYADYAVNDLRSLERVRKAGWHLLQIFGENAKAKKITESRIAEYKLSRKNDAGAANGTINRELSLLKRALKLGENTKVARIPIIKLLPETPREGFLTHPEYLKLHAALPDDLKDPIQFLYLSGWRVSEMRSLKWSDVDRPGKAIRLRIANSKGKSTRLLKPSGELWAVIERAAARQIPDLPFVFHRDGKAIGLFRKSWATACKAAGVPGLIVHDLRRCAVRNLVRAGISETVAMKITGHKTRSIFDRYNITSETDITDAGAALDAFIAAQPKVTADVIPFRKSA
jgi:integrase